jgi:hypothetical protein
MSACENRSEFFGGKCTITVLLLGFGRDRPFGVQEFFVCVGGMVSLTSSSRQSIAIFDSCHMNNEVGTDKFATPTQQRMATCDAPYL